VDVDIFLLQHDLIGFQSSHSSDSHDVINERHVLESDLRSSPVSNSSLFEYVISLEVTEFSAAILRAVCRVREEVGSKSVARVSNIVDEVGVRSIALVARLHPSSVNTSSSNRVLNDIATAATSTE
jgi:hypothetical protein